MAPKFYGPYQITKKISQVVYELHLPNKSRIDNVFHVSCLKIMLGKHQMVQTILPMLDDEGRVILEQEAIIATRERRLRSRTLKEYLIRWKNFQMKMHHGRQNNFINNIRFYPCLEDKAF